MDKRLSNAEHRHELKVSTGILTDHLAIMGYEIVLPFETSFPCLRRVMRPNNTVAEQASTLLVADTKCTTLPSEDGVSPFLLFLRSNEDEQCDQAIWAKKTRSKVCIVRATKSGQDIDTLLSDIQGSFLSIDDYAYRSALALSTPKPLQTLVDLAETGIGLFISIVDSNYQLLAYTRGIKPLDDINRSLIELGYHSDEILASQRHGDYLSEEIKYQTGIKEYPASESIPCSLMTAPLFLQQRYMGLVVMATSADHFTQGQHDLFEMFMGLCNMLLKRKLGLSAGQEELDQKFLLHLISTEGLEASYIYRQMALLNIPTQGCFMMVMIEVHQDMAAQVGFILDEIRATKEAYALPVTCDDAIVVLLNAQDGAQLTKSVESLLDSRAGEYLERIYESEIFGDYRSINVAYRSLLVARDFAPLTAAPIWEDEPEDSKVIPFAEVFTFVMVDPECSTDVKYFAASNTVIERILENDAEKGTNDFELLAAYLSKGSKASRVADLFHLHRNGVAYRIDRIQSRFNIDLECPAIRNYVQTAIFFKITTDPECARKVLERPKE